MENTHDSLLLIGVLGIVAIVASVLASRLKAPLLLVFLCLGMLAGQDGFGHIAFNDFQLSYFLGSLALTVILFNGGLKTERSFISIALWPSVTLATAGVFITAAGVGSVARLLFHLDWAQSLLVGAAVAPTDAAAVATLLKNGPFKVPHRVAAILEMESGLNDPHRTGNWITAECCGLYTIGVLYPELKESAQWRQMALDRFVVEINKLVPPDGMEAELSPGYDTSTIEQFTVPTQLAPLNNLPLPDIFRTKLISMYKALVLVMDQSGTDVPTNDSWIINAATLAPRGLKLGDDPLLEWAASWGRKGTAPPDSTMLPYAGFYAMRSGWKPDDMFLFFRGGPVGIGHQHEEDLEVALRAWKKTLLYDPGTFAYDQSEMRRYVLGTSSHSTIMVDGKWQHAGSSPIPTTPVSNPWVTTPLFDFVASTFDKGYQENVYAPGAGFNPMKWAGELDKSVTHTRRVLYLRPYYALVLDTLDGTGSHTYDNLFQMNAPAATVDPGTHAVVSRRTDGVQLALYPLEQENLTADVVVGHKDPPIAGWFPMQNRPTATVGFHKQQEAPAIFATFLYPYQGNAQPAFQAQALTAQGDNVWSQSFSTPQEKAEVAMVKDNKTEPLSITSALAGTVRVEAAGWVIRQPAGATQTWQGGWGVQSYRDGRTAFTVDPPASMVLRERREWTRGL